jgi:hypothetical protein
VFYEQVVERRLNAQCDPDHVDTGFGMGEEFLHAPGRQSRLHALHAMQVSMLHEFAN